MQTWIVKKPVGWRFNGFHCRTEWIALRRLIFLRLVWDILDVVRFIFQVTLHIDSRLTLLGWKIYWNSTGPTPSILHQFKKNIASNKKPQTSKQIKLSKPIKCLSKPIKSAKVVCFSNGLFGLPWRWGNRLIWQDESNQLI